MRLSILRATAYHEAGHMVAAWRMHVKIHTATIVPTEDYEGCVHHESPLRGIKLDVDGSDRAEIKANKMVLICLAGPAAQRHYNPRSLDSSVRRWHGESRRIADVADRGLGRLNWAGSGPTGVASGRTGAHAIAVVHCRREIGFTPDSYRPHCQDRYGWQQWNKSRLNRSLALEDADLRGRVRRGARRTNMSTAGRRLSF